MSEHDPQNTPDTSAGNNDMKEIDLSLSQAFYPFLMIVALSPLWCQWLSRAFGITKTGETVIFIMLMILFALYLAFPWLVKAFLIYVRHVLAQIGGDE